MTVQHVVLNYTEYLADYKWNSRSETRAKFSGPHKDGVEGEDTDEENPGIAGLAKSMELTGQDTEVDVVIPTDGPNKGKKILATGFRRHTAVVTLATAEKPSSVKGLKPGQICCKLHEGLTEVEARQLNLKENVRDQLPAADVAYGIGKLKEANPKATQEEIAAVMGKSVPHVSKLIQVVTGLKPALFKDWREGPNKPLPVATVVTISQLPAKEQDGAYKEAHEARASKGKDADPNAWIENAKKAAERLGQQVGTLARLGVIHGYGAEEVVVDGEAADPSSMSGELIKEVIKVKTQVTVVDSDGNPVMFENEKGEQKPKKKPVTKKITNAIAKAFDTGYNEGILEPEEETSEEAEEEEEEAAE